MALAWVQHLVLKRSRMYTHRRSWAAILKIEVIWTILKCDTKDWKISIFY